MSVIIETHVRSITVMQGCGVIIMLESGVIGPRWGLPEWLGLMTTVLLRPANVCRGYMYATPTTTSLRSHVAMETLRVRTDLWKVVELRLVFSFHSFISRYKK
jgi:hypothetical protein